MAKDSAPKTQEPKSLDESKKEEKAKSTSSAASSFSDEEEDEEEYEEEYLEVDPNDFEEVDPEDLEGMDLDELYEVVDEEYEEELAEGELTAESEDESSRGEKKKWKSILSSSSDEEEEEDSEDSDDSEWEDSGEDEDGDQSDERSLTNNLPEENVRLLTEAREDMESREDRSMPTYEEMEEKIVYKRDRFDFPEDPEGWREEDLREFWEDAPFEMTKPGWDPVWADDDDWNVVKKMEEEGEDPPIAPFYVPYRRPYPIIPRNHPDIYSPKTVIEELDRIEEFLKWVSYIFPDGSS